MEDRVLLMVGRIVRSHGVRGEVKVAPESDDPERLLALDRVFLGEDEASAQPVEVESARLQQSKKGHTILMLFAGVDGRDAADSLRYLTVFAAEDDLPPLEEGEYFLHALIGSRVETEDGEQVGILGEILELPAHHVYIVKRPDQQDVMIPAVPAFIETVDVDAKCIVVRPIEGLLDG